MFSINSDEVLQQTSKLKNKFEKYPKFAIDKGLNDVSDYLNTPLVKLSIYPPSQSGQHFIWSSERQRKAFFATNGFGRGIPTTRTFELANAGTFRVDSRYSSLYVYYQNTASYAKWVIGQFTRIIGHIARGWKPVNTVITDQFHDEVLTRFREAVIKAWDNDQFISGGGSGL